MVGHTAGTSSQGCRPFAFKQRTTAVFRPRRNWRGTVTEARRQKATPEQFPGNGPVEIAKAYVELTQEAFAVWIRLMVMSEDELRSGRVGIARLLGYSERRSNEVLRQLEMAGYVSFQPNYGGGRLTRVNIMRRALISARTNFTRLSGLFALLASAALPRVTFVQRGNTTKPVSVALTQGVSRTYPGGESYFPRQALTPTIESGAEEAGGGAMLAASRVGFDYVGDRQKFVDEGMYTPTAAVPTKDPSVSLSRLQEDRGRLKVERSETVASTRATQSRVARVQGRVPGTIDWVSLDKLEDPVVTFDPSSRRHELLISILERPKNDKFRIAVEEKLTTEFCRIYTRYRREAERRRKGTSSYNIASEERRYAKEAAIMCLRKGVTPRQLLQYWDANIGSFAQRDMVLPPLSFLKAPANIDRVACSTLAEVTAGVAPPPAAGVKPAGGNSYAAQGRLHPQLRRVLEQGGYPTQSYNDKFMLTVQHNAELLAAGTSVFLPAGKAKDMAVFASEVLYADG